MSASSLAVDALTSWEQVASYWDANFGKDGNKYYNRLQKPCLVRLLEDKLVKSKTGICRALEFATGNGICARFLASHGVEVLATDGAEQMLEIAKEHVGEGSGLKIKWRRVDVTKREELEVLVRENPEGFDIILINMAIMDIATTDPLAEAIPKMLAGDGVYDPLRIFVSFSQPLLTVLVKLCCLGAPSRLRNVQCLPQYRAEIQP